MGWSARRRWLQIPGMSNISHNQSMIEFDAAYREMFFVVKETAGNPVNAERPDMPFFCFKSDSLESVRVHDV
jgi:hypothetical protein